MQRGLPGAAVCACQPQCSQLTGNSAWLRNSYSPTESTSALYDDFSGNPVIIGRVLPVKPLDMTKTEVQSLAKQVSRRYIFRSWLGIPIIIFIFAGLLVAPRTHPYRDYFCWGIAIVSWVLLIFLMRFLARKTQVDCDELGAICPKCKAPLFSFRYGIYKIARSGICPTCRSRIYDTDVT